MLGVHIPMSLGLAGLLQPSGLREQIAWAAALRAEKDGDAARFRGVQLNAAAGDCRPREMGRSARRDLAALLRRNELECSGVDLWLPPEHLIDPTKSDRALAALLEALDFAADLAELAGGRAVLSTTLLPPTVDGMAGVMTALRDHGAGRGARIADHRWPQWLAAEKAEQRVMEAEDSPIGVGIDPAGIYLSEGPLADPAREVSRLGRRVASVRLSDAGGSGRCEVGAPGARLDVLGLKVAAVTAGYAGFLVVDVRGLSDQRRGAERALGM